MGDVLPDAENAALTVMVLVADDEPTILAVVEDALCEGGFTVITAANGKEAMRQIDLNATQLQALVVDIRMGDGPDGWAVARHGREANTNLAVVYASGDSAAEWAARGVPNSLMLQKPFTQAQVVTAVASLLNQIASPGPSPA